MEIVWWNRQCNILLSQLEILKYTQQANLFVFPQFKKSQTIVDSEESQADNMAPILVISLACFIGSKVEVWAGEGIIVNN